MDKFSELKAAAEKYSLTFNAHKESPKDADAVVAWDEATGEMSRLINNDEVNIIVALLAKLEKKDREIAVIAMVTNDQVNDVADHWRAALTESQTEIEEKDRRIAELEEQRATWASRAETLGSKLDAAEKRLATPVPLPVVLMGYQSDEYRDGFIHGVERSAEEIRDAGFKCEGDE